MPLRERDGIPGDMGQLFSFNSLSLSDWCVFNLIDYDVGEHVPFSPTVKSKRNVLSVHLHTL